MTTFVPRQPYSQDELSKLYPKELDLQLVQVLLRHGERTPVNPRFQNTGLWPYWPYCNSAKQFTSAIMASTDGTKWDQLKYQRRLETFNSDDSPVFASGVSGEHDAICQPGELTDKGRETTLALGQRLRHLYIDQLSFMPKSMTDSDMIYLRATPIPRALESVQQAFYGFYPPSARKSDLDLTIVTRTPADETLFPNDSNCRRLAHLSRAFAKRAAERHNDTEDMDYLSKLLSKWMPGENQKVAVDSHPRLSGIMDTVNATDAHGPATKLPKEFYDPKARSIIDRIAVEEWYAGYKESAEYRMLGIGGLMGDITSRMTGSAERNDGNAGDLGRTKFALSGCHDTTLAAVLTSLGAFNDENWPPFTSHIAVELFRKKAKSDSQTAVDPPSPSPMGSKSQSWWTSLFGAATNASSPAQGIARKPLADLSAEQKDRLEGYYVRIRYNDKVMQVPGCKPQGKHLEGEESFCTLEAFKDIVDKYTPKNWKHACASNVDAPFFPAQPEPAGFA